MIHEVSDEVIDQICSDLDEQVARPRVAAVARDVAAGFGEARITTYIGLFVRRFTREHLMREVQQQASSEPEAMHRDRDPRSDAAARSRRARHDSEATKRRALHDSHPAPSH